MSFFRSKQADTLARKSTEELQRTIKLLETILDNTHFLVAYLDRDLNFIRVNRAYAEAIQKEPDFFLGKNYFEVCSSTKDKEIFKRVVETGEPYHERLKPLVCVDYPEQGAVYWKWNLDPIKDERGKVTGLVLAISNITECVEAEQKLTLTRDHLEKAQRIAHIGSWELDLVKNELTWTDELYRIFGIPLNTPLTYETFLNAVHPDDRERVNAEWVAALTGKPYDIKHRIVVDHTIKWVHEQARVSFDQNGKAIRGTGIAQEITKEKEWEKMQLDLLSLASHQLRTPLSGTKWLIETLRKGIHGPLNEKQTEYLKEIYQINERMTQLVFDMLNTLRIESGIVMPHKKEFLISPLFTKIQKNLNAIATQKTISLRFSDSDNLSLNTDPDILSDILSGLTSNAIIYSLPGSTVLINATKTPDGALFSVKDSGIGIPKEEQAQIFTRFYRASNAKIHNLQGTGLGLYITAMLTKKIGARIWFESEEGKGSTFYILIPYTPKE